MPVVPAHEDAWPGNHSCSSEIIRFLAAKGEIERMNAGHRRSSSGGRWRGHFLIFVFAAAVFVDL